MREEDQRQLLQRLQQLESEIGHLRAEVARTVPAESSGAAPLPPPPLPPPAPALPPRVSPGPPPLPGPAARATGAGTGALDRFSTLLSLENILSKIGIGLLILGVIYLLKISIDRGWFTPEVRIGLGLALATGLLVGGLRLLERRLVLGQVLLGGAMAIYYACFYASEQFYGMLKSTPAFAAMLLVTIGGYVLAWRKKIPGPVVIGTLGGLAAPFLLGNHDLAVVPVACYTLILVAGAAAVYLRMGWVSVWWSGMLGGIFILFSLGNHVAVSSPQHQIDQTVLTLVLCTWWALYAGTPVWRLLRLGDTTPTLRATLLIGAFLVPALALGGIMGTWDLPKSPAGWLTLATAAVYFGLARLFSGQAIHQRAHRLSALLLGVTGLLLLLQGDMGFIVVVALAFVLMEAYLRTREDVVQAFGHLTFALVGIWLLVRFFDQAYLPYVIRPEALANLAAVLAMLLVWLRNPTAPWRGVYWIAGTVFALAWLAREAGLSSEPLAWMTLLWGVYSLVLIVCSVVQWNAWVRRTGLVLLVVVLAKMILVDLANVPTEWRVVLFLGFGGLLLGISYLLPRIAPDWNKKPSDLSPAGGAGESGSGPPPLP